MTQDQAFLIMKTGVNIYLTGSAGSGKTYLLNKYIEYLENHNIPVAVTASTGIAATHMNGMTIHSWSGIGIKSFLDERGLDELEEKKYLWKRFDKARVLIIDEISMLHASQLDMIEKVCRRFKRNDKPFGGLQVILSCDFFQLPPINKSITTSEHGQSEATNESGMIFRGKAWQVLNPAVCYLEEQHRQKDDTLTEILNTIRSNTMEEKHYEQLRGRIGAKLKNEIKATKLYTHNINVDEINSIELGLIDDKERILEMTSSGPEHLVDILKKSCLAHEKLKLKIGAEIMCIKNNFEEGYVNGSRGKIIGFEKETENPIIELYNSGKKISLKPELWAIEEDGKIKASVSQIPLRLAWAITIHKSQGMSLDNALIDLSRSFSYGMGYVALSRVRSLEGISLVGFNADALRVDPDILEFDQELKNNSFSNELLFRKLSSEEQSKLEVDFINKMGGDLHEGKKTKKGNIKDTKIPTILVTKELLDKGMNIKEITKERGMVVGTIISHIEQIVEKYPETILTQIRPKEENINAVKKANSKLKGDAVGKLSPIKTILDKEKKNLSFEEIRIAKLFI